MTTIFERVNTALSGLSPAIPFAMEVYKQVGSSSLPVQFITYQMIFSDSVEHADNVEVSRAYHVQVNIMSTTGLNSLPNVDAAMIAAGFSRGPERTLPQDQETGHYILSKDYLYFDTS